MKTRPDKKELLIALAGNPNSGKTTLFNAITGARQHVGNYPGITVEKKEGFYEYNGITLRLVDLPGTYSLTAYSLEELVARDFLVQEKPQAVIDIVDASNIERNLYLTVQLMELGIPVVLALNMMDVAASRGIEINVKELSSRLAIPVVPTVARQASGIKPLLDVAVEVASRDPGEFKPLDISYGPDIDPALTRMEKIIRDNDFLTDRYPARWIALKYLEADNQVIKAGNKHNAQVSQELSRISREVEEHIQKTLDSYPEAVIADHRYGYISALVKGVVIQKGQMDRLYVSDYIDRVVTHRFLGPIIMLLILYGVYQFTFTYSEYPVDLLEKMFSSLGNWVDKILPSGPIKSLIISGVIDGVGGVLGFVPLIMFMFLAIAFLEDTGYLARVAYMLDRVFRIFGLHGNSFIAFLISGGIAGGCAVPGVMATRTLRSSRERIATILTVPFMNCGAKIPVFAMLIAAFFGHHQALLMFILTLLSWIIALLAALLMRSTILRGPSTPFLLELPPYRFPTFKGLWIHTWERTWQYLRKAGTVILGISILLWALMSYPELPEERLQTFAEKRTAVIMRVPKPFQPAVLGVEPMPDNAPKEVFDARRELSAIDAEEAAEKLRYTFAGRLGRSLEGISHLCGFNWRVNVALIGGFAAKEVIISTLGTAYSLGNRGGESEPLSHRLAEDPLVTPLSAFALMVFIMLYSPCFVSLVLIAKEAGSFKWAVFSMCFNTLIAFVLATLIFQGGRCLGIR